ncbi:hypothetical protein D1007_38351 [Hordeum vulgare]|nr:hypothetical protein D1007_38351 [Hordeum vulgare]
MARSRAGISGMGRRRLEVASSSGMGPARSFGRGGGALGWRTTRAAAEAVRAETCAMSCYQTRFGSDRSLHCRCPPLTKQGRFWFFHHIRNYSGFFPCKAKLSDGSVQDIYRDTSVRLDVKLADVDHQELESMKEKVVGNLVERIGESIVWGPEQEVSLQRFDNYYGEYVRIEDGESMVAEIDQQEGWACKQVTFYADLIDLQTNSIVGYVSSKMAALLEDDVWVSQKNDLVIAPISDIDMAEMFGIQVDDKDKEKDDSSLPADGNTRPRDANEDEEELMRMAADDVAADNELVCLYDKENPVIDVGKLWPSMVEFRMSFRTYAVKKEFEANTMCTDRKKFYARSKGYDGGGNACKWGQASNSDTTGGQQE